ncbi:hypothetical protein RHGRI_028867 [Rhododendron griersonianum]|uniref:Histone H2A n=1 Tax=Rhododendron griersonianum TaxID=479676 RepID=A0AAV6IHC9_9ERIC|nr:hypothetical protein RHGRI_028867 [Rhododendron griersonianum]
MEKQKISVNSKMRRVLDNAVLGLAENAARDTKKTRIVQRHIQLTVRNDEELSKLLGDVMIVNGGGSSKPSANED